MRLLNLGLSLSVSTENNIQVVYGRGQLRGKIIAWKCVFQFNSNLKSRQFGFTNNTESIACIEQAIKYRDLTIKWIHLNN